MDSEATEMPCIVCGNSSNFNCQRCGESYCNDVCQRKDWQRHKHFCTVMPSLVRVKSIKSGATVSREAGAIVAPRPLERASSKCTIESTMENLSINEAGGNNNPSTEGLPVIKLSSEWRNHVNPPENEFFNCRVTYKEKDDSLWVVEESNAEHLERLADNMARSMQNKKPCNIREIAIGDLVGVAFDKKMYRAEVIGLKSNVKCEVRLIDYGAVATIDAQDVYLAAPRMAEIKAYAFRGKMACKEDVEVNKLLSVCLLGGKNDDGIYQLQLKMNKTVPLDLPMQELFSNPEVILVKTLKHNDSLNEPQVALLQMKKSSQINDKLHFTLFKNCGMKLMEPFPEKLPSTFCVAALTKEGYRRAFLLDFIEQPSMFLIYEMDEGRISITSEVRRIPDELLNHPLHVFAVTLANGKTSSLQQILSKCGRDLAIKFQEEGAEKVRTSQATLLAHNEEVCAVRVDSFMGRIAELGLKYWQEPIENGSLVYVTHFSNYHTICISSVQTKQYTKIFKSLLSKCLPFSECSDISIGSTVLVVCPKGRIYRGMVVADFKNSLYEVCNIDTGIAYKVPSTYLRQSCAFLENLPVSQCRASIHTICKIPPEIVPPNTMAMQLLTKLYEDKIELQVQFADFECSTLDLLDTNAEPPSLVARLLGVIFTPTAVYLEPAKDLREAPGHVPQLEQEPQLPPSPPSSPIIAENIAIQIERYYFVDLNRELPPLGSNVQIMILNSMDLHQTGYFTACFFSSEKVAEDFQNLLTLVADLGKDDKLLPGYLPDVGELCLTLYAEDNSWYRGVCLKVRGHDVEILYCDFGNSEVVPLEKIKPIPTELLQTVYGTKCFIDGFDKSKNFKILEEYLTINNNIFCNILEGPKPNTRLINIPKLDKILSKGLK